MKTILLLTACYDEPHRTMGSVPKIARQLSKHARVVVFSGGATTRIEDRSPTLRIYFFKEWLFKDPANYGVIPRQMYKLDQVMKKEWPDMFLSVKYMFYPNILTLYLKMQGKKVITATDAFPGYSWFSASKFVNFVLWFYTRTIGSWILHASKKVLLFHQGLEEDAKKLKLNYDVVPNGVELDVVDKAKAKKLAGQINIVYLGRLESVKGYETIFAAMQQLTKKYPKLHFYHLGNNKDKPAFVKKHKNDQIHFVGQIPNTEVYAYLKGADVVVLASKSEGLPNALLEGMACECVPISTKVGAVPYVLEQGKLGLFIEYGDEQGLIDQVEYLINNPKKRKELAKKCRTKIQQEYNWEALGKRYYKELCAASLE